MGLTLLTTADLYAAWQMKAGLVANVVYVPETLATWRYYEGQGSGRVHQKALEEGWLHQMGVEAVDWLRTLDAELSRSITLLGIMDWFLWPRLAFLLKKPHEWHTLMTNICSHPRLWQSFILRALHKKNKISFYSKPDTVRATITKLQS